MTLPRNNQITRRNIASDPKKKANETTSHVIKEAAEKASGLGGLWSRFIGPKEMPPRWTTAWYGEMVLVCTVFAITGTSTMVLVRQT